MTARPPRGQPASEIRCVNDEWRQYESRCAERFYNQRGTAEQHIKEGKHAINWTRLSCKGKTQNEVRLQLHALAYNLGVFLQGTDLPEEMADWSLTSLQTRLIKIGARVVRHARAITFQLAEVAVSGDLFRRILTAIHGLRAPPAST
jgi:Transposase DDE domain group 1